MVREKHWPKDYKKLGKYRSALQSLVFNCIPKNLVPVNVGKKRPTKRATSDQRNVTVDELSSFISKDILPHLILLQIFWYNRLIADHFSAPFILTELATALLSVNHIYFCKFSTSWFDNFTFECYHLGVKHCIPSLTRNRIVE